MIYPANLTEVLVAYRSRQTDAERLGPPRRPSPRRRRTNR
jgi:hypothetical protein